VLTALAKDDDQDVRLRVAENPATPEVVVWQLARNDSKAFRQRLAGSRDIVPSVFMVLAKDDDRSVRRIVAENPKIPAEVLAVLAQDDDVHVRRAVARNNRVPMEVKKDLSRDHDGRVRAAAAGRLGRVLPTETMMVLAEDSVTFVRLCLVENPFTPAEVLAVLADDDDAEVRRLAMRHRNFLTPKPTSTGPTGEGHAAELEFVEESDGHAAELELVEAENQIQSVYVCECGWSSLRLGWGGVGVGYIYHWGRYRRHRAEMGLN
jgi:hypothetical protein